MSSTMQLARLAIYYYAIGKAAYTTAKNPYNLQLKTEVAVLASTTKTYERSTFFR
jgi:hypothetical protein